MLGMIYIIPSSDSNQDGYIYYMILLCLNKNHSKHLSLVLPVDQDKTDRSSRPPRRTRFAKAKTKKKNRENKKEISATSKSWHQECSTPYSPRKTYKMRCGHPKRWLCRVIHWIQIKLHPRKLTAGTWKSPVWKGKSSEPSTSIVRQKQLPAAQDFTSQVLREFRRLGVWRGSEEFTLKCLVFIQISKGLRIVRRGMHPP